MKNKEYFKDFDDFDEESQKLLLSSFGSVINETSYSNSTKNQPLSRNKNSNSESKDDQYINLTLLINDLRIAYQSAKGSSFLFEYKRYVNNLPQTYILDGENHHIDISAKISLKDGNIQVSNLVKWDRPFMEMYLNQDHRLNFTLSLKYEDEEDVAIVLKTTSFESFKYLLLHIGYGNIETDKNSVRYFTQYFTYFLNHSQTAKELAVVYSQLPLGFIKNIDLTTSKVISQLIILAKEDDTGWFSWTKDTSSLLIKAMGMFRNYKEVADFFWKNPKLLTEIYDKLDGTSEVLGIRLSNRIIFTSVLNNIARNGSDLKNRITKNALLTGKGYSIESNILELNDTLNTIKGALSLDWDFDYKDSIFLQQKKTVTQTIEQQETDEFGKGGTTTEQTVITNKDVDPGYLYHPLHLVHYLDQETKKADMVTALFLKAVADEKKWVEVMRCIRIGGDIIAIFAGLFTMGLTGQASVLAIADIGLATADLIMMDEDVKQFLSQYAEGKWFVENWDVIYGLVGMGILSVVMVEGILTYGPALVEKLKSINNLKANYRIFTEQMEKLITELDAYQAKNATTAIEEVVISGGQNNLLKKLLKLVSSQQENLQFIATDLAKKGLSVRKLSENEYGVLYKGEVLKTGKDFEIGTFLRKYFWKSLQKASTELTELKNIFEDFVKSVKEFSLDKNFARESFGLFQNKDWIKLEELFKEKNIKWPPNRGGFDIEEITLKTGTLVDRYGGKYDEFGNFIDTGTFVSPKGMNFEKRALPNEHQQNPLKVYEILKPIKATKKAKIIPWFNKKGLGIQYELPENIDELIQEGFLKLKN